jgi:hypothetical protein
MDSDVIEIINNFLISAEKNNIQVKTIGFPIPEINMQDPVEHLKSYIVKVKQ